MKLTKTIEYDEERVTVSIEDPTVTTGDGRDEAMIAMLNQLLIVGKPQDGAENNGAPWRS